MGRTETGESGPTEGRTSGRNEENPTFGKQKGEGKRIVCVTKMGRPRDCTTRLDGPGKVGPSL